MIWRIWYPTETLELRAATEAAAWLAALRARPSLVPMAVQAMREAVTVIRLPLGEER